MSRLKEVTRRKVDRGRIVGVRIAIMGGRSGSGAASAILCDYARICQNRDSGDQNRVHNCSHNRVRNRAESCTLTTPNKDGVSIYNFTPRGLGASYPLISM